MKNIKSNNIFIYTIFMTISSFCYAEPTEDSFLCAADDAVGFKYENGSWEKASFDISEEKFIIRRINENEIGFKDKENPYAIYKLGKNTSTLRCPSPDKASGNFFCRLGNMGQLSFSPESGRFIKTYNFGYWQGSDDINDQPHIMKGRCSKI